VDFAVPSDWRQLVSSVRQFTEQEVDPVWREIEESDEVPTPVLEHAAELGLFGLTIPAEFGGLGLPMLAKALVYEQLGRTHAGFTSIIGTHCGIGTTAIVMLGTDDQKQKYLPRLASGELIAAFALTEPNSGSDAGSLTTRAERHGDRYVLNGTKHFITNAHVAKVFTVFAKTDAAAGSRGISAFLVERDTPGLSISRFQPTMGLRGSHVAELVFQDCEVPRDSLLGEEGAGYRAALATLSHGRVGIAARCVGASAKATELAVTYALGRYQFGKPISEFQLIQAHLADMAAETAAARALTFSVAALIDEGQTARKESSMAKLVATETYGRVVDRALQVHGGMGYCTESEIEHFYRDARITRIYEGTSEVQRLIIARELLAEHAGIA
jgi:acyl-CoA dehydrogenase